MAKCIVVIAASSDTATSNMTKDAAWIKLRTGRVLIARIPENE
jgi:hypothetical protein